VATTWTSFHLPFVAPDIFNKAACIIDEGFVGPAVADFDNESLRAERAAD